MLGDNSTSNARRKYLVHFDQVELMGEGDPLGFDEEVSRDCILVHTLQSRLLEVSVRVKILSLYGMMPLRHPCCIHHLQRVC